ncbi:hypothetical protein AVEN_155709-1 [Araneus ventricosus]|uniref:Uncharacterized protein n=1 Tax=Araneus ventricosus TaxID=182803 RepID=A0A4Y2HXF9_ARAVE|nr:hypothetical protein AVEN_155709-1 [Araneus ventricosus]
MKNDALLHEYSRNYEVQVTRKTELVQISNRSRQQIPNDNRNNTINSAQRLTADHLALQTAFQRVPYSSQKVGYLWLSEQGVTSHEIFQKDLYISILKSPNVRQGWSHLLPLCYESL